MLGALANPYIDIIGHPGNPAYEIDVQAVVNEAARRNKLLEINNHSFRSRRGSGPVCCAIAKACKERGVRICVSSDAHTCFCVGKFDLAIEALESVDFPEELIVSRNMAAFDAYLAERRARIEALA